VSLRGQALIDAARARARGPERETPRTDGVRWASGAGAPAFGARALPERHRPGFAPASEGKGMAQNREGMYGPRFGAAPLAMTDAQIQALYLLMVSALGVH